MSNSRAALANSNRGLLAGLLSLIAVASAAVAMTAHGAGGPTTSQAGAITAADGTRGMGPSGDGIPDQIVLRDGDGDGQAGRPRLLARAGRGR